MRDRFYSTADLARVCGVSISTIKRWTDAGLLRCVRTPGGHRKYRVQDVADAAGRLGLSCADAEERPSARVDELALLLLQGDRAALADRVALALATGDAPAVRGTLLDLHRHGMRLMDAGLLLRAALLRLDADLAARETDAFRRRRAQALAVGTVRHLLAQAPEPRPDAPLAILGATPRSRDELSPHYVQIVLAECRWRSIDLGRAVTPEIVRGGLMAERTDLVVLLEEDATEGLATALFETVAASGAELVCLDGSDASLDALRGRAAERERRLIAALV